MDNKQILDTLMEAVRMARDYPELEAKLAAVCKENTEFKLKMEKLQKQIKTIKSQLAEEEP